MKKVKRRAAAATAQVAPSAAPAAERKVLQRRTRKGLAYSASYTLPLPRPRPHREKDVDLSPGVFFSQAYGGGY